MDHTIAAVATPMGEGGIGIVRLSGPRSVQIADEIFRSKRGKKLVNLGTYRLIYGQIVDPPTQDTIDECIVVVMRAPHSYTGEDVVELQCHGGVVSVQTVLNLALKHGAKLAEPGEFTKRAFLNGRLDLSQAEAVIDIIRASTPLGLGVAVDQLEGSLSRRIKSLQDNLYGIIVKVEASVDFPEEDLPEVDLIELEQTMIESSSAITNLLQTADDGKILREGLKTVIVGKPNVGKSSLLNKLLDENRALVTDIPGTTRDTIEEMINLRGIPLRLIDTAGIRESEDLVEQLGVARSKDLIEEADLILHVLDSSAPLTAEDYQILENAEKKRRIILVNKVDLDSAWDLSDLGQLGETPILEMSLVNQGQDLVDKLAKVIISQVGSGAILSSAGSKALVTRTRHKQALQESQKALERALATFKSGLPLDLIAVDLYEALEYLGEITGETVRENVLDKIFAQFCIGK